MYTKIKTTGTSTYDIVIPSDYMIKRMADEGLLAEIDMSNLENYRLIDDRFKVLSTIRIINIPSHTCGERSESYIIPQWSMMWSTVGRSCGTKSMHGKYS